jgi:beta-glucosidase
VSGASEIDAGGLPPGFEWAVATAAHQIEGGNWNNDWWRFEHTAGSGCTEPSGDACDSYNRFDEDVALVADLGFSHYRFSLEWSRIEPAKGEWSQAALDHYRRCCESLKARGVEPVVTFHHFTSPIWLAAEGGWENETVADRFADFCARAAEGLEGLVARVCTINEPNIVAVCGWLYGVFPPGRSGDRAGRAEVNENFVRAHRLAVEAIRAAAPGVPVGLTLSMTDYVAVDGGDERLERTRRRMEDEFLDAVQGDDFLGVQTYTRVRIGPDGRLPPEAGVPVTQMGYEFWPEALGATLRRAWSYTGGRVPLVVTENGIGTADDNQRIEYVRRALGCVVDALADGVNVRGYTYWSLLDNFEWTYGYRPRFGLVAVDRETFERTPKRSARWLGSLARSNSLPPA